MENYKFKTVQEAGVFLKQQIENDLIHQIKNYDYAVLIVPGGNSIKLFFPYLASINLPWEKITIGLSDERCVPIDHEMSNERQLHQHFLNLVPNYNYCPLNEDLLSKILGCSPVAVLSMGTDGHLASLFPEEAKDWKNIGAGFFKTKKQQPNRISLTEEALLLFSKIYLLIVGEEKNKFVDKEKLSLFSLSSVYKTAVWIRC